MGIALRVDQGGGYGTFLQLRRAVVEVFPHEILGEGEGRKHHLLDHLEALHVDHRLADDVPDEGYVDTGLVLRQLALELRQAQTEVLAQHLEQGHVEDRLVVVRSEEHTSELQSLMRISYAVFCLKKKKNKHHLHHTVETYITKYDGNY